MGLRVIVLGEMTFADWVREFRDPEPRAKSDAEEIADLERMLDETPQEGR